jgi:hypothetical protein
MQVWGETKGTSYNVPVKRKNRKKIKPLKTMASKETLIAENSSPFESLQGFCCFGFRRIPRQ